MKSDIIIEIDFNIDEDKAIVRTNAKKEGLREILGNWLLSQVGKGADKSKPNEKEKFKIVIGLDLGTDTFTTESDTGNESLTCGIVRLDVFDKLDDLEIEALAA